MNEKCEKCGGELIEGEMTSMYGIFFYPDIFFYPKGEVGKLSPKRSPITCFCCKKCGHIQDIKAKELDKLQTFNK